MNNLNGLLYKVINYNYDFCCLCYNNIDGEPIRFADNVGSGTNLSPNVSVAEIMLCLFGNTIFEQISIFDAVCQQCIATATTSYNFIKEAKETTQHLCNVVDQLADCVANVPRDIKDCKTLFVAINPGLCTTNQYYDNIGFITSRKQALQRLQSIINLKSARDDGKIQIDLPVQNEAEVKCTLCYKIYTSAQNMKNHFVRVHAPKVFKCPDCPKKFGSESYVSVHIAESHVDLICSECGKTFKNKHSLRTHEQSHYLRLVCQDCGRVYKNQNTYRTHLKNNICQNQMRNSPADGKFTCDYCQKRYSQKMTLRVHIQYEHLGYKYLNCKWCEKKFSCKSRLNAHAIKHTKVKNFVCTLCDRKFVTKESLLYHTRIHTGERPYPCPHCDSRFLSASRRAVHVKSYHEDPTVECDICHNKFRSHYYLHKHKRTHASSAKTKQDTPSNSLASKKQTQPNPLQNDKVSKEEKVVKPIRKDEISLEVNSLKFYYEIDADGKLIPHFNPPQTETITKDIVSAEELYSDENVQYIFKLSDVEQIVGQKVYVEGEDNDEYILKVTKNVDA